MWFFLEQTNMLVESLVKAFMNLFEDENKKVSVRHNLTCRSIRRSQHKQGITKEPTANSTASNILLHVIDENM